MDGDSSITMLLFCGVEDEIKDVLGGSLLRAACVSVLQSEKRSRYLIIAQPLPAEGNKGVQLQVDHISRCSPGCATTCPWTTSSASQHACQQLLHRRLYIAQDSLTSVLSAKLAPN